MSFTRVEVLQEFAAAQSIATQLVFDYQSDSLARRSALHVEHQREYENRIKLRGGEGLKRRRAASAAIAAAYYAGLSGEALDRKRERARQRHAALSAEALEQKRERERQRYAQLSPEALEQKRAQSRESARLRASRKVKR